MAISVADEFRTAVRDAKRPETVEFYGFTPGQRVVHDVRQGLTDPAV